jgi:rRNA-processing protein FCF1
MHAQASGDDAIVAEAIRQLAEGDGRRVVVATADRGLRDRVTAAGAETASPKWLLEQL